MPRISFSSDGTFHILEKAYVRTPAGAKKYGQPIGTWIVPDKAKRAAKEVLTVALPGEPRKKPSKKVKVTQSTPAKVKREMKAGDKKQPVGDPTSKKSRRKQSPVVALAERNERKRGGSIPLNRDADVAGLEAQVKEIKARYGIKGSRKLAFLLNPKGPVSDETDRESLARAVFTLISGTPHRHLVRDKTGGVKLGSASSDLTTWARRRARGAIGLGLEPERQEEAASRAMKRFSEEWLSLEGDLPRAVSGHKERAAALGDRRTEHVRRSGLGRATGISDLDEYMNLARWRLGAFLNSEIRSEREMRGNAERRLSRKQREEGSRRVLESLADAATAKSADKRLRDRKAVIDNAEEVDAVPTVLALALTAKRGELTRGQGEKALSPSAQKMNDAMRHALRPAFDQVGDLTGVITIEIPDKNNPEGTRPIRRRIDFDLDDMHDFTGLEILAVMTKDASRTNPDAAADRFTDVEISEAFRSVGTEIGTKTISDARKSGLARIARRMQDRALAQYFDDKEFAEKERGYRDFVEFRRRVDSRRAVAGRALINEVEAADEVLSIISGRFKNEPANRDKFIEIAGHARQARELALERARSLSRGEELPTFSVSTDAGASDAVLARTLRRRTRDLPERRETIAVPRPSRGASGPDDAPVTAAADSKARRAAVPYANAGKASSNPDLRQLADSLAEHHRSRVAQVERLEAQGAKKSSDEYKAAKKAVAESARDIKTQIRGIKSKHKISVAVDQKTGIPTAAQLKRAVATDKSRADRRRPKSVSDTAGGGFARVKGKPMEEMTMRQISAEISALQTEIRRSGGDLSTPANRDKNNRIARLREHRSRRRSGELKMVRKSVLNLFAEDESDMVIAL